MSRYALVSSHQDGDQIVPLSLFLESNKINAVLGGIEKTGLFSAEIQPMLEDTGQGHILLFSPSKLHTYKKA
ncbi:hypothetical protein [Shewanella psychrophila]|uniref:hypothetical protein n=1 Tax=Shewanella psychrophila TaxID=225848 RepID=UPI00098A2683|nr:hypothetical protein [Shewanella psychrophila]